MMKRLGAMRPRERRLALIAAVFTGSWVMISWLVQPLWDRAAALRDRVENQTGRLHAINRLLAQAPVIERQQQALAAYLAPEPDDGTRAFLDQLDALSRTANVRLNLKPKPLTRDSRQSRFEVEVEAEGTQETLFRFVDALLTLPKLVTIQQLRISHAPTKEALLRANLLIEKLTVASPLAATSP